VRQTAERPRADIQDTRPRAAEAEAAADADAERGSAVIEFVMVSLLLALLLFGVVQVAAVFYVRSVVAAAASDGARYGANSGVDPAAGGPRARQLIARGLSDSLAGGFDCVGGQESDPVSGTAVATVRCQGRLRSVFLPLGALFETGATGQSLREQQ
jgi:Flp pilus assembly protein TadG